MSWPSVKECETNNQGQRPRKIMPKAKKLSTEMKKIQKLEVQDENLYTLPKAEQKAVDREVDQIVDLFMGECLNPGDNKDEKYVCEQIADVASDEFRKMVRLLVTKRLLDIKTSLVLRINFHGKNLPLEPLKKFLQHYNIISLKKSGAKKQATFYVAVCGSYETFDKLCAIGRTVIDDVPVSFKSMHLAGPAKMNRKTAMELRKRYIMRQVDHSGENILKPAHSKTVKKEVTTATENKTIKGEPADKKNVVANVKTEKGETVQQCKIETKPDENMTSSGVNDIAQAENDDWGEGGVPWSDNDGPGDNAEDQDMDNIHEDDLEDY